MLLTPCGGSNLPAYDHLGAADHNLSAVRSGISQSSGGLATNHHRCGSHGNGVRRSHADACVAHYGRGHKADENLGDTWRDDRSAYVRNGRCAGSLHRAHMHIR